MKRIFVGGLGLVLLLAACEAPQAAPSSAAPAVKASAEAPVSGGRPALCDAQRPAQVQPFPYNRDAKTRDAVLGAGRGRGRDGYFGGIATYEDLDAEELAWLIDERFIDPYEAQNAAPQVWDIFRFLCEHPTVRAAGYVVGLDRDDYRTSIETIYADRIDSGLRAAAEPFCADADETTFDGALECFWD